VCIICGAVGSLVVGNRMAFFSDALAHCAFAGVTLGVLLSLAIRPTGGIDWDATIPTVMVAFGILVGLAIVWVREKTGLSNDTVIGVFFAGAVGFGGMMLQLLNRNNFIDPESFLFGNPLAAYEQEIIILAILALALAMVMIPAFNSWVFGSFNPTLARSRGIRVRLLNYVFIVVLALIVNLSIKAVGALLINALLVVPAATAANLSNNIRHVFWWGVGLSLGAGLIGYWLSSVVLIPLGGGATLELKTGGTIIMLTVLTFFASLVVRALRDRKTPTLAAAK
jgi:zinc transport system permease protein